MSRPTETIEIVTNPLETEEILFKHFTVDEINALFSKGEMEVLRWMAERRLIRNKMYRHDCLYYMHLIKDKTKKIGPRWKCSSHCKKSRSVFTNSFFEDIKINLRNNFRCLYMWGENSLQSRIVEEFNLNRNTVCELVKD